MMMRRRRMMKASAVGDLTLSRDVLDDY